MRGVKKLLTGCVLTVALAATAVSAFATSGYTTPAEAVAGITGKATESVMAERMESGKTCGIIAAEAGKLDEFKAEMIQLKKDRLAAKVEEGIITQEKADAVLKAVEENQAACDGTGSAGMGPGAGAKCGASVAGQGPDGVPHGAGMGRGQGSGAGMGRGQGGGLNMRGGICINR